jgi:hypothetical protein
MCKFVDIVYLLHILGMTLKFMHLSASERCAEGAFTTISGCVGTIHNANVSQNLKLQYYTMKDNQLHAADAS